MAMAIFCFRFGGKSVFEWEYGGTSEKECEQKLVAAICMRWLQMRETEVWESEGITDFGTAAKLDH